MRPVSRKLAMTRIVTEFMISKIRLGMWATKGFTRNDVKMQLENTGQNENVGLN